MGIIPNDLSKETHLFLIYENRITDVRLIAPVIGLDSQHRVTVK